MGTQLYALFGSPIQSSPSPAMQNAAFADLGLDARFELRPAKAGEAERVLAETRGELQGANITTPLKTEIAARVPRLGGADRAGAVNTLWWRDGDLVGSLTDIDGVREPLAETEFHGGGAVLILGAGGAARAAAVGLEEIGCDVHVAARRHEAARDVLTLLPATAANPDRAWALDDRDGLANLFGRIEVVVQATPVGRDESRHELPWALAAANLIAFEMVTVPRRTPFLEEAAAQGLRTIEGWRMLVAQGVACCRIWTGREPSRQKMAEAARTACG